MKIKKSIILLITFLTVVWAFQYFLGYIRGLHLILWIVGLCIWSLLLIIGVFQILKYVIEKDKQFERLTFALIILTLLTLSFFTPFGFIDWEKFESENYLVADVRAHKIKLKPNNKFKYTSSNKDFYFGTYDISNDTLYLYSNQDTPYMDKISYAILQKTNNKQETYNSLCLYQNLERKRGSCITMRITSVQMEKLE